MEASPPSTRGYLGYFYNIMKIILNILNNFLLIFNPHKSKDEKKSIEDIEILHHSANFIIISKGFDILINSNKPKDKVTVQTQLKNRFPQIVNPQLRHELYFVHRLDYSTSGVMCIPTNKKACALAGKAFEHQKVDKYYLAIVRGHISQEILDINLGIGEDVRPEFQGIRMASERSPFVTKTRSAYTKVLVLERGISHDFPATKVLLKPLSGRRHQLRVHLSEFGHTIVGDYTYSNRRDSVPFRMFLHAFRLVLPTRVENIDIQTNDCFSQADPRNKWTPVEFVNPLDIYAMEKLKGETSIS